MTRRHVVLGNGIAGQACAEELRRLDADCSIAMVAAERHPLYDRAALPRLLDGRQRQDGLLLRSPEEYGDLGIEIHFETWATEVDARERVVRTNRAQELHYDRLLIATGGRPKPPPWPGSDEVDEAFGLRTLDDARALAGKLEGAACVLVAGGGRVALQLAETIAGRRGPSLVWATRGPWPLPDLLDREGGELCRRLAEQAGVELVAEELTRFSRREGRYAGETVSGRRVEFDLLAYDAGLDYYLEPALGTGIETRRGVVTDSRLRTAVPDVYAAGDVALVLDLLVGRHTQLGSWDHALAQGTLAARNMAGEDRELLAVSTYTTGVFGSTLTLLGITPDVEPGLESRGSHSLEEGFYRRLYFQEERLVGAVLLGASPGQAKLVEIMRSRRAVGRAKEELLELVGPV